MKADSIKYVVPIYIVNSAGEKEFNGTGFIVENLLITAGHVTINEKILIIKFNNNEYTLNDPLYEKYDQNINGNIKHDLSIYRIDFAHSSLSFAENEITDKMKCELYGYSYDEQILCADSKIIMVRDFAYDYTKRPPLRLNNSSLFSPNSGKRGNSGCPIFNNEGKIIGMLTGSIGQIIYAEEGILIKGNYISEIIRNCPTK